MSQNNFFNKILKKMNDNDKLTKSINLFQYPTNKSKNSPRSPIYPINFKQQIDIIQLPKDKEGFEYALVVADYKRYIGIEPLKKIDSKSVLKALQRIYKRDKVLKYPSILQADNGSEFKGEFKKFFGKSDSKTQLQFIKPYRSRQNGLVESINGLIGRIIGLYQAQKELSTGKPNFEWKDIIQNITKSYNESQREKINKYRQTIKKNRYPKCKGDDCKLLRVGDIVRIPLEHPINSYDGSLTKGSKKFRSNDQRYKNKNFKIKRVVLLPNQPPLYMVNQKDRVAYTKGQLVKIKSNEIDDIQDEEPLEGFYIPERILAKKKIKGKIHYKIQWKGYSEDDSTWESRISLKNQIGQARVADLEHSFKK